MAREIRVPRLIPDLVSRAPFAGRRYEILHSGAPSRWAPFRFASPNRLYARFECRCSVLAHRSSIASRATASLVEIPCAPHRFARIRAACSFLFSWICPVAAAPFPVPCFALATKRPQPHRAVAAPGHIASYCARLALTCCSCASPSARVAAPHRARRGNDMSDSHRCVHRM